MTESRQIIKNPYVPPKRPVLLGGRNGHPRLVMAGDDGARAELCLHGARLTSWVPSGGGEWLDLNAEEGADGTGPPPGGIGLTFPQAGSADFAARSDWQLVQVSQTSAVVTARLRLTDSRSSRDRWRWRFQLDLLVTLGGATLNLHWQLKNTGQSSLECFPEAQLPLRLATGTVEYLAPARAQPRQPLLLRDGDRTLEISSQALSCLPPPTPAGSVLRLSLRAESNNPLVLPPGQPWRAALRLVAGTDAHSHLHPAGATAWEPSGSRLPLP
ncbi:MAG: hypothetical protein GX093_12680 [Xanthomonadaceae bacterium]|nr:hypothetical protein [Xanthomonadaceae bacterium]